MFESMAPSPPRQGRPGAEGGAAPAVTTGATVIRSIITELACAALDEVPDQELRRETVELARVLASLQAQVFRRVAAIGERTGPGRRHRPGASAGDVATWLRSEVGLAPTEAHRWVRTAVSLYPASSASESAVGGGDLTDDAARSKRDRTFVGRTVPRRLDSTREALERGVITAGHAEVITRTLSRLDDALRREAQASTEPRGDAGSHGDQGSHGGEESTGGDAEASGNGVARDNASGARGQVLAEVEALLLTRAKNVDVAELSRTATYARNTLDPEGARRDRKADEAERFLETSPTSTGGLRLRGYLTGPGAASLQAALDSFSAPAPADDATPDPRTASQRRADALSEISRRVLHAGEACSTGGVRPQVQVLVPLPALTVLQGLGGADVSQARDTDNSGPSRSEGAVPGPSGSAAPGGVTAFGQVLDQDTVRQLACDATLTRLVVPAGDVTGRLADRGALIRMLTAPSRPLDVGRSERSVTPPMRAALVARDRHCAFPGCDRPHTWCDAHHVRHWADGGATSLDNLVLLCGRHHTAVHHDGWRVHVEPGTGLPTFTPPRRQSPPGLPPPASLPPPTLVPAPHLAAKGAPDPVRSLHIPGPLPHARTPPDHEASERVRDRHERPESESWTTESEHPPVMRVAARNADAVRGPESASGTSKAPRPSARLWSLGGEE